MLYKTTLISEDQDAEGVKIVYDDVAPYAKENSTVSITKAGLRPRTGLYPRTGLHPSKTIIEKEYPELKQNGITYPGYALCLPEFALLNGSYINFPDNPQPYGYISPEISNESKKFND